MEDEVLERSNNGGSYRRWGTRALQKILAIRGRKRYGGRSYVKLSRTVRGRKRRILRFLVAKKLRVGFFQALRWQLIRKTIIRFYRKLIRAFIEAGPAMEQIHAAAMVGAHLGMPALPPSYYYHAASYEVV